MGAIPSGRNAAAFQVSYDETWMRDDKKTYWGTDGDAYTYWDATNSVRQVYGKINYSTCGGGVNDALLHGAGSSSSYCGNSASAGSFMEYRMEDTATSGITRGLELRMKRTAAGTATGGVLRAVEYLHAAVANIGAISTCLDCNSDATISGSASCVNSQISLANTAYTTGSWYALDAAIYSAGSTSALPAGSHCILRLAATGNATGARAVKNAIYFSAACDDASGRMIYDHTGSESDDATGTIRILVDETAATPVVRYLRYWDAETPS